MEQCDFANRAKAILELEDNVFGLAIAGLLLTYKSLSPPTLT